MVKKYIQHTGKLDLACGDRKVEGFFGIDLHKTDSTDANFDLLKFPWPIESDSVEEIHCSHFMEHIPKGLRKRFMEEIHRVLKVGKGAQIITPRGNRMSQDMTHEWPEVVPDFYLYFNQDWLKNNKLMHGDYLTTANFDFSYGEALHPNVSSRNAEFQQYALQFYINASTDLYVTVVKK